MLFWHEKNKLHTKIDVFMSFHVSVLQEETVTIIIRKGLREEGVYEDTHLR